MQNSLLLAATFLLFANFPTGQDTKPSEQSAAQKNLCDQAMTQLEMNQCSGERYRKSDARLNTLYAKLIQLIEKDLAMAQQKKDAEETSYNNAAVQKLKTTERAWIQYRDLHCDAARHQFQGGSMSPMVWADCMAKTTDHRIEELKDAYGSGDRQLE